MPKLPAPDGEENSCEGMGTRCHSKGRPGCGSAAAAPVPPAAHAVYRSGSDPSLDGLGAPRKGSGLPQGEKPFRRTEASGFMPEASVYIPYWYSLGTRKLCTPLASSVTVPAGKMITGLPSSSTSNSVFSSMVT